MVLSVMGIGCCIISTFRERKKEKKETSFVFEENVEIPFREGKGTREKDRSFAITCLAEKE